MNKKIASKSKEKPLTKEGFFKALNKVVQAKPAKRRGKRSARGTTRTSG
jgi:hypothetical protein